MKINDDCECQEVVPPPRKFKPMHITFLIDGSDGYNEKTRNKIGYTEGIFSVKNALCLQFEVTDHFQPMHLI